MNEIKDFDSFLTWASDYQVAYDSIKSKYPNIYTEMLQFVYQYYDRKNVSGLSSSDINKRREECFDKLPKTALSKKEIKELKELLFELKDETLVYFVIEYCKMQSSRLWMMIVANEYSFYEYSELLLRRIQEDGNDLLKGAQIKGKLMEDMDAIDKRLVGYYKELFPFTDNIEVRGKEMIRLTPEKIAREGI